MDAQSVTFDPGFRGQVGHRLKSLDEGRSAVGIAGIIHRIDADEDVTGIQDFCPGHRDRQHDRIACGHVGDRDAASIAVLRYGDAGISQCRSAELPQFDPGQAVLPGAERVGNTLGGGQLGCVTLTVRH
ncbi:hypothetical protein SDC9_179765 [bioreactor metagenome]|uniref:Uncharacterized protein n=1 Tax=bioreactor metagenome TaxID=1076179 RepID=A0A645GZS4_9ZZZZ